MKKILFALVMLFTSAMFVKAQTTAAPADPERLNLVSKTNELEASLIRNQPKMTQTVMPEIITMMQNRLNRNSFDMRALSPSDKKIAMAKIQKERTLFTDFQKLSSDPGKNKKELVAKARAFIEIY